MSPTPCPQCEDAVLEPRGPGELCCPRCRGTWCGKGHLPALVGGPVGHPLLALESLPLRRTEGGCPACGDTYLHSVQPSPGAEVRLGYCPACAGVWVPDGAVVALHGLVAASPLWDVPSPGIPVLRAEPASPDRDAPAWDRFDYDVPLINGLAVPIAFLFGLLVHAFGLSRFCVDLLVSMPLHELGHATMAWFGGHYAMPLPFITFSVTQEKSFWVALALGALLMAGLLLGLRERRRYLVALSGAGLVLQLGLTLLVPGPTAARMITWSGCAGELVWPTLLLVSFHYRLPDRIRWDFWRYVALLFGACAFVHAMARWQGVAADLGTLPVGTALGGRDDPQGDMNKLLRAGWSARGIAASYLTLAWVGLAVVAAHWGVFLRRSLQQAREE